MKSIFPGMGIAVPLLAALIVPAWSLANDVDEIIVTVRKQEENLQEIPVAAGVLSQEQIEKERIRTLADVAIQSPNIQFDNGFWQSDTRVTIRGLFARTGRPSAAVLIDGIDAMSESLNSSGGSALLNQRILDLERIEIARGPQSALYGRGAFSGAINYVTRRPEPEWAATASVDAAEGDRYELQATAQGPITDSLAFGVLLSRYDIGGWYTNPITGQDVGDSESQGIGFSLNWTPNETFNGYLNLTYSNSESGPQAIGFVRANRLRVLEANSNTLVADAGACPPDTGTEDYRCLSVLQGTIDSNESDISQVPDPRTFDVDGPAPTGPVGSNYKETEDEILRASLILSWDFDNIGLKSSTSFVDATTDFFLDPSRGFGIPTTGQPNDQPLFGTLGNYGDNVSLQDFRQFYQDFQLNGDTDGGLNWLVGVNGFYEDAEDRNNSAVWYRDDITCLIFSGASCDYLPTSPFPTTRFDKTQSWETTSLSAYGLIGIPIGERWKLTFEGRYIYDKLKVEGTTSDVLADILDPNFLAYFGTPGFADSVDDTNFVPRASVDFQMLENVMLYASVANGIKPPSFGRADIRGLETAPGSGVYDARDQRVEKEDLWTYELGAKTQWLERRVTLNTAIYYNDYQDQQLRVQGTEPGATIAKSVAVNAGEVSVWGLELDSSWQITDNLFVSANYAFADSEYDNFVVTEVAPPSIDVSSSETVKAGNAAADYTGNKSPGVSKHAVTLQGQYSRALTANADWYARASWQWQDKRYADIANLVTLNSYSLVNAQLGIESDSWSLSLYGENLFDDDTIRFAQEYIDQTEGIRLNLGFTFPVAYLAYLPQPRTFGVRFAYRTR